MNLDLLNELTPSLYLASELDLIGWSALSDSDKLVALQRAENFISGLLFEDGVEVSDDFKVALNKATACVVYDFLLYSKTSHTTAIRSGLKSYSGPDVSESYADIAELKNLSFVSDSYKAYLYPYLYSGVR